MSKKPLPPGVHIVLGDWTAGIFTRVFDPSDRLVIDRDVLCCGPTPRCESLEAWRAARQAFWNTMPDPDTAGLGLIDERERLREAEQVTIWAATSVSEQLFITHVLHRAEEWGIDRSKIRLVQFEVSRSHARVLGMGELNEEHMSEHPAPAPLSDASFEDYRAAWSALTSADPTQIERFSESRPGANAWLKQAMHLLLRRFPGKQSGVSWWDLALLRQVRARGPRAARVIGFTMVRDCEDPDLVGDVYLFGRLLRMGDPRLPSPLLQITGDRTNLHATEVALTPFGADVLDGKASSYPANPMEDWVAGVKLSSTDGVLWFNDGGALVRGE